MHDPLNIKSDEISSYIKFEDIIKKKLKKTRCNIQTTLRFAHTVC